MSNVVTIREMAEVYISALGVKRAIKEVEHLIQLVSSREGKEHWCKVLIEIREILQ